MDEQEYLRRYLPRGASSGNDVLFNERQGDTTPPTEEQLRDSVRDLVPLLRAADHPIDLYDSGFGAVELALALLYRGTRAGVATPLGDVTNELLTEIRRLLGVGWNYGSDANKRLASLQAVLDPHGGKETS